MSIIATAPVPVGSLVTTIDTVPLPKVRTGHRKPEPPTPCPPWCVEHSTGTPGFPGDRTTGHESPRTKVATTFRSGLNDRMTDRHEVQVWAERFDLDREQDGHPVVGFPVVHMGTDGYDSTGMTAEQAERIGRALLDAAGKVRAAGRVASSSQAPASVSPVWPPSTCPSWCSQADDPAGHAERDGSADHYEDRSHIHGHYRCTGESAADCEPGEVPLTLEEIWRYETGPIGERRYASTHETLSAELSRHYRELEPRIGLQHHTGPERPGSRVDLTLAEAAELAGLLGHLVELGREG